MGVGWEELCNTIQASNQELKHALLHDFNAFQWTNGLFYQLTEESMAEILEWTMTTLRAEGVPLSKVPVEWVCRETAQSSGGDIPELLVKHCIDMFADLESTMQLDQQGRSLFMVVGEVFKPRL